MERSAMDDDDPCSLGFACRARCQERGVLARPNRARKPRGILFSRLRTGGVGLTPRKATPRNSTPRDVLEKRYTGRYTFSPVYLRPRSACASPQRAQASFVRFTYQTQAQAGPMRNADQQHRRSFGRANVLQGGGAGFAG